MAEGIDEVIYIHVENQHPDSLRFLHDCEKLLGRQITVMKSSMYKDVDDVIERKRFVNGPFGAACTKALKRDVRKEWELTHLGMHTYVWGFDVNEKSRAERVVESMTRYKHEFPLIDNQLTKQDAHGLAKKLGLKRPVMYDMGYSNNNCIGCVKGGMGYWNKIRVDFPEVFERRAKQERMIGHSCIKGVYLDELDPSRGRMEKEVMEDCSILCQIAYERG